MISGEPGAGQDDAGRGAARGGTGESLRPLLRGDSRARGADHARRVLRGSAARPRRHRRDLAARPGQVRAGDAAGSDRGRRGARRGGVRAHAGDQRRLRIHVHRPRQQRARSAERARERRAHGRRERDRARSCGACSRRRSTSIVHVDRDDAPRDAGVGAAAGDRDHRGRPDPRRRADVRADLRARRRSGRPLEWTGALPPALEARVDRALPRGDTRARAARIAESGAHERRSPRSRSASAARCVAAAMSGTMPRRRARSDRAASARRARAERADRGCSKRASGSEPAPFWAGARSPASFAVARRSPRSPDRSSSRSCPGVAVALLPRAYFGRRRRARCARCKRAWPDGLRDIVASIAAGLSLTQAVTNLAATGPPALRVAFARFPAARARCSAPGPRSSC